MKIDEQNNCSYLNHRLVFHVFPISDLEGKKEFKFMRIRQTGPNWCDSDGWRNILLFAALNSIEYLIYKNGY